LKNFLRQRSTNDSQRGLGLKKLAYEIQNKKSGFYHSFEFRAPGELLQAFETEFRGMKEYAFPNSDVRQTRHCLGRKKKKKLKAKSIT
jgi:small subunit ribosomal protein S6